MKTWGKWIIGALVVTLVSVLGFGINPVSAQDSDDDLVYPHGQVADIVLGAVAEATGLTEDEIIAQLRDGNSLLDILDAEGVDSQAVIDSITEQANAAIDQAVADSKLTETQADFLKDRLPTMIDHMLNFGRFARAMMEDFGRGMHGGRQGMFGNRGGRMFGMWGEHGGMFGMWGERGGMFGHMGRRGMRHW
jgi:hypothetical protein